MIRTKYTIAAAAALGCSVAAGAASAAHLSYFQAELTPLNDSGISGFVSLIYDGPQDDGNRTLTVQVTAQGAVPGPHPQHIHGFTGVDGVVQDSVSPAGVFDPDVDGDADGFTELSEGAPFYGGILQTFDGLTAGPGGFIRYRNTFDVAEGSQLDSDLYSLANRETVLHGLFTDFAVGAVAPFPGGEVDTSISAPGTYNALLPIASGEFSQIAAVDLAPVPLPAGIWLLGAALGGFGALRARKKRA